MESLASIYDKILKDRPQRMQPEPKDVSPAEPKCPVCQGTTWISRHVPLGDPGFGQAVACECQTERNIETLLRIADLPFKDRPRTIDTYKALDGCSDALNATRAMIEGKMRWNILTLTGSVGLGKTHLLEALGRAVVLKGVIVKYLYQPDWVGQLRAASAVDATVDVEEIWQSLQRVELVLLDDLTERRVTPFAIDQVERLVDGRYRNGGLLVVTTNLDFKDFAQVWGERLADRLFEGDSDTVRLSKLTGPSYRTGEDWRGTR